MASLQEDNGLIEQIPFLHKSVSNPKFFISQYDIDTNRKYIEPYANILSIQFKLSSELLEKTVMEQEPLMTVFARIGALISLFQIGIFIKYYHRRIFEQNLSDKFEQDLYKLHQKNEERNVTTINKDNDSVDEALIIGPPIRGN